MMNAIETSNLTKYYDMLCAVEDLTLSINNEIFALLGPNGSGKTTTVLMLTTLLHPTRGSATVCGNDIISKAEKVRSCISYVPQDMAVDIKLTGRENVRFFADLYGVPDANDRVDEVLAVMELTDRADDLIRTYSGGMRRRLELAQALVHASQQAQETETLTERERDVLKLMVEGLNNAEIAERLGIARGTLETYYDRIIHRS